MPFSAGLLDLFSTEHRLVKPSPVLGDQMDIHSTKPADRDHRLHVALVALICTAELSDYANVCA